MSRVLRIAALFALASVLAACSEKPQVAAGRQIQGSEPGWQGPVTVFTVAGWKVGDERSWQSHLQTRAQAQNEYVRLGAGH
jgi:hypothetical protein